MAGRQGRSLAWVMVALVAILALVGGATYLVLENSDPDGGGGSKADPARPGVDVADPAVWLPIDSRPR